MAHVGLGLESPLWFRLAGKPQRAHMHGSQRVEEMCEDLGIRVGPQSCRQGFRVYNDHSTAALKILCGQARKESM